MVVNRRKKLQKYRGSHTHGGGSMKKRRGAGHRGGRGMAGSGKRADAKKPSIGLNYFGKFGFKKKGIDASPKTINLIEVDATIEKIGKKEGDYYTVDLSKLGYGKLLGNGAVTKKIKIVVDSATHKAIDKIKKAGGDIKTAQVEKSESQEKKEEENVSME